MTSAKQTTLFSFDAVPVSEGPVWLEDFDGNRRSICRMDAEAGGGSEQDAFGEGLMVEMP